MNVQTAGDRTTGSTRSVGTVAGIANLAVDACLPIELFSLLERTMSQGTTPQDFVIRKGALLLAGRAVLVMVVRVVVVVVVVVVVGFDLFRWERSGPTERRGAEG